MSDISFSLDGQRVGCAAGTSILSAAEQHGIWIPTLCHHQDLDPYGACRLCLVEDEKSGRIMASCVTPTAPDMSVLTDSPRIKKHRRNIIRMMMAEHPESCIVCSKGNRCRLRLIAARLGVAQPGLYPMPNYRPIEQANPFLTRDLSKCILCGQCIRADHELVVVGAIGYNHRGFQSRPATIHEQPLEGSACTFCGTCLSMCPTGALAPKHDRFVGTPERESLTVCGFCGVGCSMSMGVFDETVIEVNPAKRPSVNRSTLCVRGHFAYDFLSSNRRLTQPLIRRNGELVSASWDEALQTAAERLLDIKKEYGPHSVAFLGSSKCTNEENYLFQKIARVLLRTNNVDNCSTLSEGHVWRSIEEKLRIRANNLSELDKAEVIMVWGADPDHSAPVLGYHLRRAARRGAQRRVVDPRRTELAGLASLWLAPRPATDFDLVNSLAAELIMKNGQDQSFIDRFTTGFGPYTEALAAIDPKRVERMTGVTGAAINEVVDIIRGKRPAIVPGRGILQQRHGSKTLAALANLALLTGSFGIEGAGFHIPSYESNQVGARDMGSAPGALPGRQSVKNEPDRKEWERRWRADISPDPGWGVVRMIEEMEAGHLKAVYVMGENPLQRLPEPARVRKAFEKLDFLMVQDILDYETLELADLVLPGAAFCEKSGSFTNMEGFIQTFDPVIPPPGQAKPDWEILGLLAEKMGYPEKYGSLEKIRKEMIRFIPSYAGLEHIEPGGLEFRTMIGESNTFSREESEGQCLSFFPVESIGEVKADEAYPLTMILGSSRFHMGSGARTGRSPRLRRFAPPGSLEISRDDGEALGLRDGDAVRIVSGYGFLEREVRLTGGLKSGLVFLPASFNANDAARLVGLKPLDSPDSPGLITCAVKLEKLKGEG